MFHGIVLGRANVHVEEEFSLDVMRTEFTETTGEARGQRQGSWSVGGTMGRDELSFLHCGLVLVMASQSGHLLTSQVTMLLRPIL